MSTVNFKNRWEDVVWEVYKSDTTAKLLLLALGRRADWTTGEKCFPGLALLAEMCCCGTDTVRRAREKVEGEGWIKCSHRAGRSTHYAFLETHYGLQADKFNQHPSQNPTPRIIQGVANSEGLDFATPPLAKGDPTPRILLPDHNQDHNHSSKSAQVQEVMTATQLVLASLVECFSRTGRDIAADDATSAAVQLLRRAQAQPCIAYVERKTEALRGRRLSDTGALKALLADAGKGLAVATARVEVAERLAAPSTVAPRQVMRSMTCEVATPTPEQDAMRRKVAARAFGGDE